MNWITAPLLKTSFKVNAEEYMSQDGMKLTNGLSKKKRFISSNGMTMKLTGKIGFTAPLQKMGFSRYDK